MRSFRESCNLSRVGIGIIKALSRYKTASMQRRLFARVPKTEGKPREMFAINKIPTKENRKENSKGNHSLLCKKIKKVLYEGL